jgi:hypothetical protein
MLASPEDMMVGTMSFASLTNVIAVGMEQWSTIVCLLLKHFLKMATPLLKCSEYFPSNSILLITETFFAAIP